MLKALPSILIFLLVLMFNIVSTPVDMLIRMLKVLSDSDEL